MVAVGLLEGRSRRSMDRSVREGDDERLLQGRLEFLAGSLRKETKVVAKRLGPWAVSHSPLTECCHPSIHAMGNYRSILNVSSTASHTHNAFIAGWKPMSQRCHIDVLRENKRDFFYKQAGAHKRPANDMVLSDGAGGNMECFLGCRLTVRSLR